MQRLELLSDLKRNKLATLIVSYMEHVWILNPISPKDIQNFTCFVNYVLGVTSLSEAMAIVGLRYLDKLRLLNPLVEPQRGSEYRLLITALMLANKVGHLILLFYFLFTYIRCRFSTTQGYQIVPGLSFLELIFTNLR